MGILINGVRFLMGPDGGADGGGDGGDAGGAGPDPVKIDLVEARKDPEFEKQFMSAIDGATTKALLTFKEKGFKTAVDAGIAAHVEQSKTKTPEQIRLDESDSKMLALEQKLATKELLEMKTANKEIGRAMFKEAGLPDGLLDFFVSDNAETSKANFEKGVKILGKFGTDVKKGVLDGNNIKVSTKTVASGGLKEPGEGASREDWKTYLKAKAKE
jgi:hypothetical protein